MPEFLPVLVVILIVVGLIDKKRKLSAGNRRPPLAESASAPVQEKAPAENQEKMSAEIQKKAPAAAQIVKPTPLQPAPTPAQPTPAPVQAAPVQTMRPRLDSAIAKGAPSDEGEDPCHAYMLDRRPGVRSNREEEDGEGPSDADVQLVRGVIMAEILKRPERRAYGRRRA